MSETNSELLATVRAKLIEFYEISDPSLYEIFLDFVAHEADAAGPLFSFAVLPVDRTHRRLANDDGYVILNTEHNDLMFYFSGDSIDWDSDRGFDKLHAVRDLEESEEVLNEMTQALDCLEMAMQLADERDLEPLRITLNKQIMELKGLINCASPRKA